MNKAWQAVVYQKKKKLSKVKPGQNYKHHAIISVDKKKPLGKEQGI